MYIGPQQGGLNREVAALYSDHITEVPLYNGLNTGQTRFIAIHVAVRYVSVFCQIGLLLSCGIYDVKNI